MPSTALTWTNRLLALLIIVTAATGSISAYGVLLARSEAAKARLQPTKADIERLQTEIDYLRKLWKADHPEIK